MKELSQFALGSLMVLGNLYFTVGAIYTLIMYKLAFSFSFQEILFRFFCWPWDLSNQIVARRKK